MLSLPWVSDHKSHKRTCKDQVTPWQPVIVVCYYYLHTYLAVFAQERCCLNGSRSPRGGTHISEREGGFE